MASSGFTSHTMNLVEAKERCARAVRFSSSSLIRTDMQTAFRGNLPSTSWTNDLCSKPRLCTCSWSRQSSLSTSSNQVWPSVCRTVCKLTVYAAPCSTARDTTQHWTPSQGHEVAHTPAKYTAPTYASPYSSLEHAQQDNSCAQVANASLRVGRLFHELPRLDHSPLGPALFNSYPSREPSFC